jgi:dCTP deaminase
MSILSNIDIEENLNLGILKVEGINKDTIRENGLDLTISEIYAIENPDYDEKYVNLHNQDPKRFKKIDTSLHGRFIIIRSNSFVLLSTKEYIELPPNIVGFCAIRSTVARSGLIAPPTIVDAGFRGTLTIEIFNASRKDIILYAGDRFLHVVLEYTRTPCSKPYSGLYQGQDEVREPKQTIE